MTQSNLIAFAVPLLLRLFAVEISLPPVTDAISHTRASALLPVPPVSLADSYVKDCLQPTAGTSNDTLQKNSLRRHAKPVYDLTRPAASAEAGALRLIAQYLERCLGTRRELFLAQEAWTHADSQTFLVRLRPQGFNSPRKLTSPEASAYLIIIDARRLVVLSAREFR